MVPPHPAHPDHHGLTMAVNEDPRRADRWDGAASLAPQNDRIQRVLNERWPLRDRQGFHARGIPDQPHPITVRARVIWEKDGEEWITGRATRWTQTSVFVVLADSRSHAIGVWLSPDDVRRV